ncbi:MAG: hypothetical protein B7Z75_13770 [Acidocella sp. 20-57-95]|nr:MAG: hypothetical protein B7Z75_13770 [Acidocella sp. 20-57-95]HQT65829.1 NrsF family protein [Acidocella sp.]HQU05073.1 NrsF family protein [Acidocella sp.]
MQTDDLITHLTQNLPPVRRAASPWALLLRWVLVTAPVLVLVVGLMGPLPHLTTLMMQPRFMRAELLAGVTALTAAYAAFCAGRPDEPVWKLWLPAAAFCLWVAELGRQCFVLSVQTKGAALVLHTDFMCIPAIAITGLFPAIAMVWFLRKRTAFRSTHASLCGAMAAAAAAEVALPLFHAADTMMMVLVWQMGSVVLFTLFAAACGRFILTEPAMI